MAGKKGRSGRKSWDHEIIFAELVELSAIVIRRALNSETLSEDKKIEIAKCIVLKKMPTEVKAPELQNTVNACFETLFTKIIPNRISDYATHQN